MIRRPGQRPFRRQPRPLRLGVVAAVGRKVRPALAGGQPRRRQLRQSPARRLNDLILQLRFVVLRQLAVSRRQPAQAAPPVWQHRPAMCMRRRQENLRRLQPELLLEPRQTPTVKAAPDGQQISADNDRPMPGGILQRQRLEPEVRGLALRWPGAGGVTCHPERVRGRNTRPRHTYLPEPLRKAGRRRVFLSDERQRRQNGTGGQQPHQSEAATAGSANNLHG